MSDPAATWRSPALGSSRTLDLPGGRIRCFDAGSGPAILFVHGIFANANLWRKVVAILADRHRCVTLDLPLGGHELAMGQDADLRPEALADLIAAAAETLALPDVTLAGNDTGGALCQIAVARHPDRFARLFLTSCDYRENFPPAGVAPIIDAARRGGLRTLLTPLRDRSLRQLPQAFGGVAKRPIDDAASDTYVLPALEDAAVRHDLERVLLALDPAPAIAAADRLRTYDRPALIAWSREDQLFPPADAEALAAQIPGARLEWIDDAYAFSPEDRPDRVAELLAGFVAAEQPQRLGTTT